MLSCFQNIKQLVILVKISHSVIKNLLHSPFFLITKVMEIFVDFYQKDFSFFN